MSLDLGEEVAWDERGYPPEFRRKVVDLVEAGRPVAQVAQDLGISAETVYTWRRQDRIDRGLVPGLTSAEKAELAAAKGRIAELETELFATRRAVGLVREVVPPKEVRSGRGDGRRRDPGRGGLPGARRVRVELLRLGTRPLSPLALRHAWLTDLIAAVHHDSRNTHGARRVHAELTIGRGVTVGHNAVEMLMPPRRPQ